MYCMVRSPSMEGGLGSGLTAESDEAGSRTDASAGFGVGVGLALHAVSAASRARHRYRRAAQRATPDLVVLSAAKDLCSLPARLAMHRSFAALRTTEKTIETG